MEAVIAVVVLVVLLPATWLVVAYNRFVRQRTLIDNSWAGVDVELTRRHDLIPNLVETVKGYAAHEKGVFEDVTAARAGVTAAAKGDDVPAKAAADAALQQALVRVNAVAENYPDLKANQNFLQLQAQLAETENQISFARQYYNDAVATLNKLVATIPWMLLVGMAGVKAREFYEAPAGSDVAPRVDFGTSAPAVAPPATPAAPAVPPPSTPPAVEPPAGASEQPPTQA